MGYTHYWDNSEIIKTEQWRNICSFAHKIINIANSYGIKIVREFNEPDSEPEINEAFICLNGLGEDGHETFYLSREITEFEFCKTNRKPYDSIVGQILWYVASQVPSFHPRNDDDVNYLECETEEEYYENLFYE